MSCVESVNHSRIKVEQNKSSFILINDDRKKHEKHEIDNCIIKDGIRCDWAIRDPSGFVVFIELKGGDLKHACEQLLATPSRPECANLIKDSKIGLVAVCTSVPKFDSYTAKTKIDAMRRYKCGFRRVKPGTAMTMNQALEIS